jgi:hypothetical protein
MAALVALVPGQAALQAQLEVLVAIVFLVH